MRKLRGGEGVRGDDDASRSGTSRRSARSSRWSAFRHVMRILIFFVSLGRISSGSLSFFIPQFEFLHAEPVDPQRTRKGKNARAFARAVWLMKLMCSSLLFSTYAMLTSCLSAAPFIHSTMCCCMFDRRCPLSDEAAMASDSRYSLLSSGLDSRSIGSTTRQWQTVSRCVCSCLSVLGEIRPKTAASDASIPTREFGCRAATTGRDCSFCSSSTAAPTAAVPAAAPALAAPTAAWPVAIGLVCVEFGLVEVDATPGATTGVDAGEPAKCPAGEGCDMKLLECLV